MGEKKVSIEDVLLLVASIIFALIVAELALRYVKPFTPGHHKLLCQHDPVLGWAKIPQTTIRRHTDEFAVTETINSRSLRGPEYSYNKAPNKFRIIVLGDSFTEGITVNFSNTFSEILKRSIKLSREHVCEVINAGTGGWSTDQELLFFLEEGIKYSPDLTILMFYAANDVFYNAKANTPRACKPLFVIQNDKLALTNVPVPKPHLIRHLRSWLSERLRLYYLPQKIFSILRSAETNSLPDEWGVFAKRPKTEIVQGWDVTERLLVRLSKETVRINSKLLVANIPFKGAIYSSYWQDIVSQYGLKAIEWDPNLPAVKIRKLCRKHGIRFIDLTAELEKAKRNVSSDRRLYYPVDNHWTEYGHYVVGKILSKYLNDSLLVE